MRSPVETRWAGVADIGVSVRIIAEAPGGRREHMEGAGHRKFPHTAAPGLDLARAARITGD